jgi:hypothetical protein
MQPLVCIVCHAHSYNDSSENRLSARSTPAEKPYTFQPNQKTRYDPEVLHFLRQELSFQEAWAQRCRRLLPVSRMAR